MIVPLVIAGVGAAASAYGAYKSGQAADAAARQNALNGRIAARQMELSKEQQEAALAGSINARGDRTRYVPGVGWVEEASPLTRALMQRSDQEELARLTQDMPRARMQREAQFRVQQGERGLADALLARTGIGTRSMQDLQADATRLGVAQATAGAQQGQRDIAMAALRQGFGPQGHAAAATAPQSATRVAIEQARSGAPRAFADNESARLNDGLNRYGNLMGRALAPDGVAFTPNTLADTLTASRAKQQQTSAYGLANASHLSPQKVETVDPMLGTRALSAAKGLGELYGAYQKWRGTPTATTSGSSNGSSYYSEDYIGR